MDLQTLLMGVMAIILPFVVSTYIWPLLQKLNARVKALPSFVQQVGITLLNAGLAFAAVTLGVMIPGVESFAPADVQVLLTGLVGFLTTLIFKNGKAAAA